MDGDGKRQASSVGLTNRGRATPLIWKTHIESELKNNRNRFEYELVEQLHEYIDPNVRITVLAVRGFGDQKFHDFLMMLGWDFVVRFRGNILVTDKDGQSMQAKKWATVSRRAKKLVDPLVTNDGFSVPAVLVCWSKKMKEPWCFATTLCEKTASEVVECYARRFTIEERFRYQKNLHLGMGLSATHIGKPARRDRILLLAALAQTLLILLGAAAEEAKLDRYLKVNTVKNANALVVSSGFVLVWSTSEYASRLVRTADDCL